MKFINSSYDQRPSRYLDSRTGPTLDIQADLDILVLAVGDVWIRGIESRTFKNANAASKNIRNGRTRGQDSFAITWKKRPNLTTHMYIKLC
jgi:hypothetical protein